jgi:hypothetical protein
MENIINHIFGRPWDVTTFVGVIVLIGTVGGLLIGLVAVVTENFRERARDEMDATLKMEMLSRGMSAQDIVQVLQARGGEVPEPAAEIFDAMWGRRRSCRAARRAMREEMRKQQREGSHA